MKSWTCGNLNEMRSKFLSLFSPLTSPALRFCLFLALYTSNVCRRYVHSLASSLFPCSYLSPLNASLSFSFPFLLSSPSLTAAKKLYQNFEAGGGLSGLNEKPRSSVSALIDILCLDKYEEDSYEGITEIVESINIQDTG